MTALKDFITQHKDNATVLAAVTTALEYSRNACKDIAEVNTIVDNLPIYTSYEELDKLTPQFRKGYWADWVYKQRNTFDIEGIPIWDDDKYMRRITSEGFEASFGRKAGRGELNRKVIMSDGVKLIYRHQQQTINKLMTRWGVALKGLLAATMEIKEVQGELEDLDLEQSEELYAYSIKMQAAHFNYEANKEKK